MGGRWAGDRRQATGNGRPAMGGRQWAMAMSEWCNALLHFARCNPAATDGQTESCHARYSVLERRKTQAQQALQHQERNGGICFKRPPAFPKVLLPTLRDPVHLRAAHAIRAVVGDG